MTVTASVNDRLARDAVSRRDDMRQRAFPPPLPDEQRLVEQILRRTAHGMLGLATLLSAVIISPTTAEAQGASAKAAPMTNSSARTTSIASATITRAVRSSDLAATLQRRVSAGLPRDGQLFANPSMFTEQGCDLDAVPGCRLIIIDMP